MKFPAVFNKEFELEKIKKPWVFSESGNIDDQETDAFAMEQMIEFLRSGQFKEQKEMHCGQLMKILVTGKLF